MNTSRKTPIISALVVGAMALAACGGSDAASDADPCEAAQTVADVFAEGEASDNAEDGLAALSKLSTAIEDLAKVAPGEFTADFELLADGMSQLAASDPEAGPSEELLAIIDGEDYDAAGERLEDYVQSTCGLDLG